MPRSASTPIRTAMRCLSLLPLCLALIACGGKDTILPQDGPTMKDVYEGHTGRMGTGSLMDARSSLRRPMSDTEQDVTPFVRDEASEIQQKFKRLPNPDIVMFSFPHLATGEEVPVPGYMTVFPMFESNHYALPGEPTE